MNSQSRFHVRAVAALLAGVCALPAAAQTAPAPAPVPRTDDGQTPAPEAATASTTPSPAEDNSVDIVVTAQRRDQRLTDVPISVAAFSGASLAQRGVSATENLAVVTPSIQVNKFIAPYQQTVRIRGVGTNVSAPTIEPSVSMVVDGVVIAQQTSFFTDLADIDRLEVLRGPQSTLFGKNAIAGALNVVTRRPNLEHFDGAVDATVNDYADVTLRGTMSGPIAGGLAFSITGIYYNEGDGVVRNVNPNGPRLDTGESAGIRGKLLWEVTPDLDVTLIGDYRHAEGPGGVRTPTRFESAAVENFYGLGPVDIDNRRVNINGTADGRHDFRTTDWGVSASIDAKLGEHALTSVTAYRRFASNFSLEVDGVNQTVTPSGYDDVVIIPGVGVVAPGRFPVIGSTFVVSVA